MPNVGQLVQFKAGLYADYAAIASKDLNTIYFCTDKQRLFVGDTEYTRPILSGSGEPATTLVRNNPQDILYFDTAASELYVSLGGAAWVKVTDKSGTDAVQSAVTQLSSRVDEVSAAADAAQQTANQAKTAAAGAQASADSAKSAADAAQAAANAAQGAADAAQQTANDAKSAAEDNAETIAAIRVKPAMNITSSQISNWDNEVGAKSDAKTAQDTADDAAAAAAAAQTTATNAGNAAAAAQTAANEAKTAASNAQATADGAKSTAEQGLADAAAASAAAASAQKTADEAKSTASQNATNIINLTNRVNTNKSDIDTLKEQIEGLNGSMHFLGTTTTKITDGSTTATVSVDGSSVTAVSGDVVIYGDAEYVFNGTKWSLFGDTSDFLLKSAASSTYETKADASAKLTESKEYAESQAAAAQAAAATDAQSKADAALEAAKADATSKTNAAQAAAATDATTKANAAEEAAKKYADGQIAAAAGNYDAKGTAQELINGLDAGAVSAGSGQVIGSVSQTNGKVAATVKTLEASDIPALPAGKVTSGVFDVARIPALTLAKISDAGTAAAKNAAENGVADNDNDLVSAKQVKTYVDAQITASALVWGEF